jgi:transposase
MFKGQLLYKGQKAGRCVEVVSERLTTQACSDCRALTGPRGAGELVVRTWVCSECGTEHDRDENSTKNILARAQVSPARPAIAPNEEGASVSGNRLR